MMIFRVNIYFKYSENEQWTGEYNYDGKKIYIKTASFITSSSNVGAWASTGIILANMYRVLDIRGYSDDGAQFNTYPRYESSSYFLNLCSGVQKDILYMCAGYPSKKITLNILYTKTTD